MKLGFVRVRVMCEHVLLTVFPNLVLFQLRRVENFKVDRVIEIVSVISNLVRQIGDLRFERWKPIFALVLPQTFAHFEGQIQSRKIGISVLKQLNHAQTLPVMLEAAVIAHAFGKYFFARMSERRMAEIVRQRDRFGEIFIERKSARDCPADRRDLNRMRKPRPQMIAGAV